MASASDTVLSGAVVGVYGVRGWLRIRSDTNPKMALARYRPWHLIDGKVATKLVPTEVREHGKGLVAKLAGVDDRDQAAALVGNDIAVPRSQLPTPNEDEYYWHDLIGLEVVTTQDKMLGKVERMIETGAHDVLVAKGPGGEVLIPFVPKDIVCDVQFDAQRIVVNWEWE
ncbi:MAG: ribosome maturation factor RimM [Pseudomonadota bacterium]